MVPQPELEAPPCTLCGGEEFRVLRDGLSDRLLGTPGKWSIAECGQCGLVQTRPRPSRAAIGRFYPAVYGEVLEAGASAERSASVAALARLPDGLYRLRYGPGLKEIEPGSGRRVLEIGCAGGTTLAAFAAAGWEVWGVEPAPDLAAAAALRAGVPAERMFVGTAEAAEFPAHCFDRVTMSHVVEHLHDPLGVLIAARRWLAPGRRIVISCPNYGSAERRLFGRSWVGLDVPRHLYHFTPRTLAALLTRAGFEDVRIAPELEFVSTGLSANAALDAARGRRPPLQGTRSMQIATAPFTLLARLIGAKPCMVASAVASE